MMICMNRCMCLLFILTLFTGPVSFAAPNYAATVIMIKGGAAKKLEGGKPVWLKEGDRIEEGALVTTNDVGAIKLMLTDQSQMSLGPGSSMKVEAKRGDAPAMVNILRGQVRAKVIQDSIVGKNFASASKSKFILRTRSATMGVRGTDFQVAFNPENNITSLVTFDGGVAMVKADPEQADAPMRPEVAQELVDNSAKAIVVSEGNFSSANPKQTEVMLPTRLSPAQFESLKNADFTKPNDTKAIAAEGAVPKEGRRFFSPIPPGADPKTFMGAASGLDRQLAANFGKDIGKEISDHRPMMGPPREGGFGNLPPPPPPEGMYDRDKGVYAPPAGSIIDLNSGIVIAPPPGSAFDPNTGVFVPPPMLGGFDPNNGQYKPPIGFELKPHGFVFVGDRPTGPPQLGGPPREGGPNKEPGGPPSGVRDPKQQGPNGPPVPGGFQGPPGQDGPFQPGDRPGPGGPDQGGHFMPPEMGGYDPSKPPVPPADMSGPCFTCGYAPPPPNGERPPFGQPGPYQPGPYQPPGAPQPFEPPKDGVGGDYYPQPQYPVDNPTCPTCVPPPTVIGPPPVNNNSTGLNFKFSVTGD